jgi:hypothetical protein
MVKAYDPLGNTQQAALNVLITNQDQLNINDIIPLSPVGNQ